MAGGHNTEFEHARPVPPARVCVSADRRSRPNAAPAGAGEGTCLPLPNYSRSQGANPVAVNAGELLKPARVSRLRTSHRPVRSGSSGRRDKPPPAKRTSSVPKPLRKVLRPLRPPNGEAFKPLLGSTPRPWTSRTSKECRWPIDPPTPGDEMQACCQPLHDHRYCRKHARWSLGPGTRAERDAA